MPCRYDESPEEIAAAKTKEFERQAAPLKKELDKVTRLLCWVMQQRELADDEVEFSQRVGKSGELSDWYTVHRKKDEARLKRELREKALKKLTREERDALDLL